jgi:hypothetical protein
MWFLLLSVVSAQPFYKDTLRQLPNKLRQERIHAAVKSKVDFIQYRILEEASNNQTTLNFTLYCFDPNLQYRETELSLNYHTVNGATHRGKVYDYKEYVSQEKFPGQSLYEIEYIQQYPYYAYQRDGMRYRHSTEHDRHIQTELIYPRPTCNPRHGYELYQRTRKLEDTPQAYTAIFFLLLNNLFPDLHMTVTDKRPSEGLYDADCCPLYTVSW